MGILAAIAIPRLGGFTERAENQAAEANHRVLVAAIQLEWSEAQTFDGNLQDLDQIGVGADETFQANGATNLQSNGGDITYVYTTANNTLTTSRGATVLISTVIE